MEHEERLTQALSDRYRMEREIGSGGMATVYLAEDLKHHRKVAVKVLNPDLAKALGTERFLREIETAAKLTHPHILPLFDSGEADGFLFYVMPYVKAESLRVRLTKEKRLPVEDAIQITREIADALDYAHGEGVIHRDVKPANIMLEAGHAVLADFGVAQALAEADQTRLTQTGVSLGTPPYMSPEQATGERELDGRTDQYALGCVLFEMLTGDPPFTGAQVESVVRQHVASEPPEITELRPSVPEGVSQALRRSLAKAPADRFKTTGQFGKVLAAQLPTPPGGLAAPGQPPRRGHQRTWARPVLIAVGVLAALGMVAIGYSAFAGREGSNLVENRVAVMQFENATGDPELDPLGRIVADRIIETLLETRLADVVSSSMTLFSPQVAELAPGAPSSADPIAVLAAGTGAGIVVGGSIFRDGDSLRIRGRITDARRMSVLATEEAAGPLADPMEGVDAVGQRVVGGLAAHLDLRLEDWVQTARHTPRLDAYLLHMQGVEAYYRQEYQVAADLNRQANALDTAFLKPLISAARAFTNLPGSGSPSEFARYSAKVDSLVSFLDERRTRLSDWEALQLDYLEAHQDQDLERLLLIRRRIHELYPGSDAAVYGHGWAAARVNRPREAIEAYRTMDPERWDARPDLWHSWVDLCFRLGEHEKALRVASEGRELFPDGRYLMVLEARSLAILGRLEEVDSVLSEMQRLPLNRTNSPGGAMREVGLVLRAQGHLEESRAYLERAVSWYRNRPESDRGHRHRFARALYVAGEWDEARELAEGLVSEVPTDWDFLGLLGAIAARQGRTEDALEIRARLAEVGAGFPRTYVLYLLWRVRIAAVLGEREQAVAELKDAHTQGLAVGGGWLYDIDFESLRGYEPFEEFMRPKG